MVSTELLRLTLIEVDGLFDVYNHRIELNLENRVTLLHGPNGVGKTVVLRMTDALLKDQLRYFQTIPFSQFVLGFHDGSTLSLKVDRRSKNRDNNYVMELKKGGKSIESSTINWNKRADVVASQKSYLRQHDTEPNYWIDLRDDELLTSAEVLSRYARSSFDSDESDGYDMSWFVNFLKNANTHLIEANRLLQTDRQSYSRAPSIKFTVVEYSNNFQIQLADTMALYGRRSQTLDQSFPQRLISATDQLSVDEIQARLTTLDNKTNQLTTMGILDNPQAHPFDMGSLENIDDTQARVMTLYVSDTEEKLKVLDDLASSTGLLLDNVNQKFRNKTIRLDREHGLVAISEKGEELPLDSLSSGEQHELVLNYDLLFRVPSNTIVLIDEPELSLHVAWQKRFLPDLLEIIRLSDFDAVVATHSPYVIGDRDDLMVGLGDKN